MTKRTLEEFSDYVLACCSCQVPFTIVHISTRGTHSCDHGYRYSLEHSYRSNSGRTGRGVYDVSSLVCFIGGGYFTAQAEVHSRYSSMLLCIGGINEHLLDTLDVGAACRITPRQGRPAIAGRFSSAALFLMTFVSRLALRTLQE